MTRTFAGLLLALLAVPAVAQISQEARRDLLLLEMAEAAMALQHPRFLELLAAYEATGGLVEPEMRFYQAAALAEGGEVLEAFTLVTEFINRMGSGHPLYRQALELYTRLEPQANALMAEARREQQRRDTLLESPLYARLVDGERLLEVQRFNTPSPWRDGSSPQDFVNHVPGTVQRVEVHHGLLPLPDGGWLAFGQRPKDGEAPEPARPRSVAAIRNGTHEPQDTFYPQAAILRFAADGELQSTRQIDWRQVYAYLVQAYMGNELRQMGLRTIPDGRGLRVIGISPIRAGVETPVQVGDIITHINRRAVDRAKAVEEHLERYRGRRPPPMRVLRKEVPLDIEVAFAPGPAWWERHLTSNTPYRYTVLAYMLDAGGRRPPNIDPTAAAAYPDWSSEIIAMVPGPDDSVTVCANIETEHGVAYWGPSYGALQLGVVLRGRLDDSAPGGVELERIAMIVHDDPWGDGRHLWWYDSGLIDCVGLPGGGLLTVSRASRTATFGNQGLLFDTGEGDTYQRMFRIYGADGRYLNAFQVRAGVPIAIERAAAAHGLQRFWYEALQPELRLQPAGDGSGLEWRWQQFLVRPRMQQFGRPRFVEGATNETSPPAVLRIDSPAAAQSDESHELVLQGAARQALLPGHAAERVLLKRALRRPDGSYVVLLGVQQTEIAIGQPVPGGVLGDVNGTRVRQFFAHHQPSDRNSADRLGRISHLAGQEDFLVGLDAEGRLLWSLRLVPERPVEADLDPYGDPVDGRSGQLAAARRTPGISQSAEAMMMEVGRVMMQEWTNLALLADDSILVTMRNGHGLRVCDPSRRGTVACQPSALHGR
jgi:hypothetical protein